MMYKRLADKRKELLLSAFSQKMLSDDFKLILDNAVLRGDKTRCESSSIVRISDPILSLSSD